MSNSDQGQYFLCRAYEAGKTKQSSGTMQRTFLMKCGLQQRPREQLATICQSVRGHLSIDFATHKQLSPAEFNTLSAHLEVFP